MEYEEEYGYGNEYGCAYEEGEEPQEEPEPEPDPEPKKLGIEAKTRIVNELTKHVAGFTGAQTREERISLTAPLTRFILEEPTMQQFIDENPGFAAVFKDRMLDFSHQLKGTFIGARCQEVLDKFFV